MKRLPTATIVIALVAIIAVGLTYFDAARLGFFWDDYLILRPRHWSELLRVWHGSWDATGYSEPFYRPLAVWTDTAAFAAFGFNEPWLRLTALAELAAGALLIGEFVRRETASTAAGSYAALLYAIHPAVSQSAGPWWFEQNHRLSIICAGLALLAWQSRRAQLSWRHWWPVHAAILAGSWFKEDVVVLAPVLLLFQWWRARTLRDEPAPTLRFASHVAAGWAVWFLIRWSLLGSVIGRPIGGPTDEWTDRLHHAGRGLWLTFLRVRAMQGEVAPVHQVATVAMAIALIATVWIWRLASARARTLLGYGVIAGLICNVPVAFASFPTRYHLIALGAVLLLAGLALAWTDRARHSRGLASVRVGCAVLAALLVFSSRANMQIYAPCTAANLHLDFQLRIWLERLPNWHDSWILSWLDVKRTRCAEGRYVAITEAIPDVLRDVREGRR